jgi:phosphomannomutase
LSSLTPLEIKQYFDYELNFGTAGIRAKTGMAPSLLNEYTIKKITIAVINHFMKVKKD